MAWNEPGGGNKDPWGNRGDQGPPDLDEVVRKMQQKLSALFGGRKGGGAGGGGGPKAGLAGFGLALGVAFIVWLFSGIYIVDAGTRGVVLRFGAFVEATQPGPHWHIPYPIEEVEIVNVEQRRVVEVGYRSGASQRAEVVPKEALMLTRDENIVNVRLAIQYQVNDPFKYLFKVRDPDAVLKQVAESAIRQIIGRGKMDFVLREGRVEVVNHTKDLMQEILNSYESGLLVSEVTLQDVQPPEEVQDSFSDVIKAREDLERLKNEAETYANDVVPRARGAAARQLQEATGYKESLIAQATGEANRFNQLLEAYKKAPDVTRKRLYLETMESVFSQTNKVLLDSESANNLVYLPIDQLLKQAPNRGDTLTTTNTGADLPTRQIEQAPRPSTRSPRETR